MYTETLHPFGDPMTPASQARIYRTVYMASTTNGGVLGRVVLGRDGEVKPRVGRNGIGISLTVDGLWVDRSSGLATSHMSYAPDANVFHSTGYDRLFLVPITEFVERPLRPDLPKLIVNSIPKSGTYFMEAALSSLGLAPLHIHLANSYFHDNRGIPAEDIHAAPYTRHVEVPSGVIAHVMQPGEMAVGHIDDHAQMDEAIAAGATLLHCVRDLRDVVISYYHFMRKSVRPRCAADEMWRTQHGAAGLAAFLVYTEERDMSFVAQMARSILGRNDPIVRYEDMVRGVLPHDAIAQLTAAGGMSEAALNSAFHGAYGQDTSTWSGGTNRRAELWSADVEHYFQQTGLAGLNVRLGYPEHP